MCDRSHLNRPGQISVQTKNEEGEEIHGSYTLPGQNTLTVWLSGGDSVTTTLTRTPTEDDAKHFLRSLTVRPEASRPWIV
jgi:hypothetical protein